MSSWSVYETEVSLHPDAVKGPFAKSVNLFESDVNKDGELTVTLKNFSGEIMVVVSILRVK